MSIETSLATLAIALADVRRAAERLRGVANRTPVVTSRTVDALVGAQVFFKCENLQRGGRLQVPRRLQPLAALSPEERARGVVAFSSGNHAQGVALAARELGIPATVVMPTDAPRAEARRHRAATAPRSCCYDRLTEDREAIARRLADERGATLIPPYDHPLIMAGQGTAALELIEDVADARLAAVPGRRRRAALGLRRRRDGAPARHQGGRRRDRDVQRLGARAWRPATACASRRPTPSPTACAPSSRAR